MSIDEISYSQEYAAWVQENALDYGYTVCNGDSLIEAMDDDDMLLAYLKHINYNDLDN